MPTVIDYDELVSRLADGTIVLLDAQAPGWFEREHLPGAHRIDWDDVAASATAVVPGGAADPHFGPVWAERLRDDIPGVESVVLLPDTGHLLMEERATEVASHLRKFLSASVGSAP